MADIFDEVDEILGEMDSSTETSAEAKSVDQSFNDSELQEIMSEIENLEKEFDENETTLSGSTVVDHVQSELDEDEYSGSSSSAEMVDEFEDYSSSTMESTPVEEAKVISIAKTPVAPVSTYTAPVAPAAAPVMNTTSSKAPEISFEASGQMNLNLGFKIGQETAKLTVDPVKGLCITMNGVELVISETEGCQVTMESGVRFTIPLTSQASASKKKSA
jgi:hypothetical protein